MHLQRVHDTSRIHLDIETDDVEAEVQRLEALGARRKAQIETWWVMEDPCGHLFCVVPMHSPNFLAESHVWEA
jgi:Glyoxalase-like domain